PAQDDAEHYSRLATEADEQLNQPAEEMDLIRLIQLDLQLSDADERQADAVSRRILRALATSQNANAMEHVRAVFENEPERRSMAAWALSEATSRRPTDLQDWRYMVRSLPVATDDDAPGILRALQRYRNRADKPYWVRHVILIGLRLPEDQQVAALGLLKHWTGVPARADASSNWTLADYQAWFADEYPEQPVAELPKDPENRRWTWATLEPELRQLHVSPELFSSGQAAYEKAACQRCHKRGDIGTSSGPDLTSLGWRRQRNEILKALLYPSHELNEEYPAVTVELNDGRTISGMMSAGTRETLVIVSLSADHPNGALQREEFARTNVTAIRNQNVSSMPEGTLEPLTLDEIKALFVFLTSVDGVPRPHGDELE
ncbi:MAG: hypothetical protein ACK58L_00810, partial [Planctomycetota bacterium]